MVRRGDRRAQFYLTAAVIIILVIVSFAGFNNYISKTESLKIYDLKDELGIESGQVLDYGIYNEFNTEETNDLLQDFTQNYSEYVESGFNLYFVFGNKAKLVVAEFRDLVVGEIGIQHGQGGGLSKLHITRGVYNATVYNASDQDEIFVNIEGQEYKFDLEPGENFYFVRTGLMMWIGIVY